MTKTHSEQDTEQKPRLLQPTAENKRRMTDLLRKIWELAQPYKLRLYLGVLTGILSGLVAPLLIVTAMLIYGAVFPPDRADDANLPIKYLPGSCKPGFIRCGTVANKEKHQC